MVRRDIRWQSVPSIKTNFQLITMNAYAKQKTIHSNEGDPPTYLINKSIVDKNPFAYNKYRGTIQPLTIGFAQITCFSLLPV